MANQRARGLLARKYRLDGHVPRHVMQKEGRLIEPAPRSRHADADHREPVRFLEPTCNSCAGQCLLHSCEAARSCVVQFINTWREPSSALLLGQDSTARPRDEPARTEEDKRWTLHIPKCAIRQLGRGDRPTCGCETSTTTRRRRGVMSL